MSVRFIQFAKAVTVPGMTGVISLWNHSVHGGKVHAELCREGVELHIGKTENGQWKPTGEVVTVFRGNIEYITEDRKGEEPKGGKR